MNVSSGLGSVVSLLVPTNWVTVAVSFISIVSPPAFAVANQHVMISHQHVEAISTTKQEAKVEAR
jgi:hypothetical protein